MTRDGVENLTLVAELTGHEGCVNCLEWNDKGTILASSSDDTSVILWNVFQRKKIASFKSGHTANVFSVNFLPFTNDNLIATCAADAGVRVWDTNAQASIYSKTSHIGRAKRIATAKDSSNVFWSAGEDGLVLQHDLRDPSPNPLHRVVLLSLISHSSNCECKCIYSNPTRPNYLAIGASDSYARVYDRRMLSPKNVVLPETFETTASWQRFNRFSSYFRNQDDFPLQKGCVRYFTPGHLPIFADDLT